MQLPQHKEWIENYTRTHARETHARAHEISATKQRIMQSVPHISAKFLKIMRKYPAKYLTSNTQ